jgi:signal transduction histidine kinase
LNKAEVEAKEALHEKSVIAGSEAIISSMLRGSVALALYNATNSKEAANSFDTIVASVPGHFNDLQTLVKENPAQLSALRSIEAFADRELSLGRAYKQALDEQDKYAKYMSMPLALTEIEGAAARLTSSLRDFEATDRKAHEDASGRQLETASHVRQWVAFGIIANIFIAIAAVIYLIRGTATRMESIIDNLERYTTQSKMPPRSAGNDRLSLLNQSLYDMVDAIGAARNKERQADSVKQHFLSTIDHELQPSLTSIEATLLMLKNGKFGEINEKAQEQVAQTEKRVHNLITIINELVEGAEIESGKLEVRLKSIDLKAVVEKALKAAHDFATEKQIKLATREIHSVTVSGDEERLVQVFTNLLTNAIKASPPNATVETEMTLQNDKIRVSISDTGYGIPLVQQDLVFNNYAPIAFDSELNSRGAGLALAICKHIVEAHSGEITFQSQQGAGTTFSVDLPLISIFSEA